LNLLFACFEAKCRKADSKIEGWEQLKQTKEGVPKRALQAGSAVSTLGASAMAQGVDWPTPMEACPQKRRAAERQARVCGPSAAWKAGTEAAQQCPEGSGLARLCCCSRCHNPNLQEGDVQEHERAALMFFNCCQRACESFASKATPIMIRWEYWCRLARSDATTRLDDE